MSASQIQEKIFDLRCEQSNCSVLQRAAIQIQIVALQAKLDSMS